MKCTKLTYAVTYIKCSKAEIAIIPINTYELTQNSTTIIQEKRVV